MRVKLLEAFASGIPVVSTYLGAEGLARTDGDFCALADDAAGFAAKVVQLLDDEAAAAAWPTRAPRGSWKNWDAAAITRKLVAKYLEILRAKRTAYFPKV